MKLEARMVLRGGVANLAEMLIQILKDSQDFANTGSTKMYVKI